MMEGDGSSASSPPALSPTRADMVVQRLRSFGVPMRTLDAKEMGLVEFVKENKGLLQDVVSVLMPDFEEAQLLGSEEPKHVWRDHEQDCSEGVRWAQWLMFGGDPEKIMKEIQQETGHIRSVCGAVWGSSDIAYKCRTCENDPTCAICVSCFESGNHMNHDYSMIHTGGGCCDCGDITAWKQSGFCSQHSGTGQAPSLSEALMSTFAPVMEALLNLWGKRLKAAANFSRGLVTKPSDSVVQQAATQTSQALVEMLLSFCNCSESLLTCICSLIACDKNGLLDLFLQSECFLSLNTLNKLHELLFKLMGNPTFKCQFAKIFVNRYPHFVREGLRQDFDSTHRGRGWESSALSSFSLQIFTVPTLTSQLVLNLKLLDMLLEALKDTFLSCSGGDGQQLASKGQGLAEFYRRIIEDIRYVLRHSEVAHYVAQERPDLLRAWLHLLAFTQGMESQRRELRNHVEEETESWFTAYNLEGLMGNIHSLLIDGVARVDSSLVVHESSTHDWTADGDVVHGHAKIGRTSMESNVSGKVGASNSLAHMDIDCQAVGAVGQDKHQFLTGGVTANVSSRAPGVPAVLLWLIAECAKVLDIWFLLDAHRETVKSSKQSVPKGGRFHGREVHLRGRENRATLWRHAGPALANVDEVLETGVDALREGTFRERLRAPQGNFGGGTGLLENDLLPVKMQEGRQGEDRSTDWWMGVERPQTGVDTEFVRNDKNWLEIVFDVSQQDVSFHIPLHRFLAVALQKSLEASPNLNQEGNKRCWHCQDQLIIEKGFLLQLFPPRYQVPAFISCLMEHPLRIKVFCAQVRAGMWRKNGHSVQALYEHYNSAKRSEGSLDLDLFLLQCCAVMAPTEEFVERIVSRFSLTEYFSLFLLRPNEYETTLAQYMLAFIIQLLVERGFCGFSAAQACRRELVKRLAISDATHSQLIKSLPPRLQESKHWQEALDLIATFYKPSGMQQGRFSLRQECWKELDLYHPRWHAKELQSAEDRYFRACKESSMIKQLPQWQKPFTPFQNLSRLATCKGVHDILRSIFFHAVFSEKLSESRAPENVLITALHLLALGLDVCSMFAYRKGLERKTGGLQSETTSSMQDSQEPPPLLSNATERVYFGGVDGTKISNRQSLISLLVLLMQRYSANEAQGVAGESHLGSMGALIKTLLEKFSKLHNGCMYKIEALAPEILHRVSSRQEDKSDSASNIAQLSSLSEVDRKKLIARERQAAVMKKMKAAQEKFVTSFQLLPEQSDMNIETLETRSPGCRQANGSNSQSDQFWQSPSAVSCALCRDSSSSSPASFLAFVQRSRLIEISEKGVSSWAKRDRSKNIEALTSKEEMALNGEVDREGPIEVEALLEFLGGEDFTDSIESSQSSIDVRMSETTSSDSGSEDLAEEENTFSGCELPNTDLEHLGVLSQKDGARVVEDEKAKTRQSSIITVLLEYASILSRIRKRHRHHHHQQQQELETDNSASSQRQSPLRYHTSAMEGLSPDHGGFNDSVGVHMSSCGHAVHQDCLDRYLSTLVQRDSRRILFEGLQIVDPYQIAKGEFLCPICRRLANSVLPYIVETFPPSADQATTVKSGLQPPTSLKLVSQVPSAMHLLCNAEELVWKSSFRKAVSRPLPKLLKSSFDSLFWRLYSLYFPGKAGDSRHNDNRVSQSLLLWNVLRYTIVSVELASRTRKEVSFSNPENNLVAMSKAVDKGSVLPVLLRAAKTLQNQNRQSLLLRARGMQLIVGSICFGVSKDSVVEPSMPGNVLKILQFVDSVKEAADTCLWRRTADPILAHDPFSSLFWIVFCLPLSFAFLLEPFISLVHLLYLVCVTQIVVLMRDTILPNLSELPFSSSASAFVQTILESLTGIPLFQPLIDEASVDLSGPVLVTIRRFTLPFLRRCALLGKLLCDMNFEENNYETVTSYRFATAEKTAKSINHEERQSVSDALEDLKELEALEQKFLLPSVQAILQSENNQEAVLRWVSHLYKEFGPRKLLPVPRPTMAALFKLMDLPPLYQTLLQRYIRARCPVCSLVPEQPALCLLCGTLCCGLGRNACCSKNRQSECSRHAMSCNGGVGVFLMIKRTTILLQRCARQAYWPSPYLDSFGEEDIEMHRGKPLYLNEERYAALTAIVASHGLDHSSLVLSHTTWETVIWG